MKSFNRRQFIRTLLIFFGTAFAARLLMSERAALSDMIKSLGMGPADSQVPQSLGTRNDQGPGNFRNVYLNPKLKAEFFFFLTTVYHLYPENAFNDLITETCSKYATDKEIYQRIQKELPRIKPFFSDLTYSLPALRQQKAEMAKQILQLLDSRKSFNGYLEMGTVGRYIGDLRKSVSIKGPIHLLNDVEPTYSLVDMLERGQITKPGDFIPLGNYEPLSPAIPDNSIELATNLIGFHHAPTDKLDGFVRSIHRILKPGGTLIVRDHDVSNDDMQLIVALAHDVFNMGLNISWDETHQQIRNFTSVKQLETYFAERGFVSSGVKLLQANDPTKNTLMQFTKS